MLGYRLYFIDRDGRIQRSLEIPVDRDEDALAVAEQHRDGLDLELWSGGRKVAVLPRL